MKVSLSNIVIILLIILLIFVIIVEIIISMYMKDDQILGITIITEPSIREVTLYVNSAFIQAYAALIAIVYTILIIHLQSRYGTLIKYILQGIGKPLIILILYIILLFSIMIINNSDLVLLFFKTINLYILVPISSILLFIVLYKSVTSLVRLSPSIIVKNLLENADPYTEDILSRIRVSLDFLRILLERPVDIGEVESILYIYSNFLSKMESSKYSRLLNIFTSEFNRTIKVPLAEAIKIYGINGKILKEFISSLIMAHIKVGNSISAEVGKEIVIELSKAYYEHLFPSLQAIEDGRSINEISVMEITVFFGYILEKIGKALDEVIDETRNIYLCVVVLAKLILPFINTIEKIRNDLLNMFNKLRLSKSTVMLYEGYLTGLTNTMEKIKRKIYRIIQKY